jgi:Raf kinase inhibitor-like YbhB/YbcL family protein
MSSHLLLTSPAFENGERIPALYTCDGKNISPPLTISGVPSETKTLALILEDPDAPMGTWYHWIIFDINPNTERITEGEEPIGIHGKGSGENMIYMGPCPPTGIHRYFFRLYALDTALALPEGVTNVEVEKAMDGHIVGESELMGTYGRP